MLAIANVRTIASSLVFLASGYAAAAEKPHMPAGCDELFTVAEYKQAGGVSEPQQVVKMPPTYPPDQLAAGVEGIVELEAIIGGAGKVIEARVISATNESFARAAAEVTLKFVYYRPRVNGRPVCLITYVTHHFKLS